MYLKQNKKRKRYKIIDKILKNILNRVTIILFFGGVLLYSTPIEFGGWVVYWDNSGFEEIEKFGGLFDRISLFSLELNEKGEAVVDGLHYKQIRKFINLSKKKRFSPWITIVNDLRRGKRKTILKDHGILRKIFYNHKIRKRNIDSIVKIMNKFGFKGLDLDFENIKNSEEKGYQNYLIELSATLKNHKKKFKVIIEPTKGPIPYWGIMNLIVMSYNLHGNFTGPGPRSTPKFIKKLKDRVDGDAKGKPSVAIALKGFFWQKNKKIIRYSWKDSQKYLKSTSLKREGKSKVPYLRDEDGNELWFEDPISLKEKIDAAVKAEFGEIMFWFLGSNDDSLYNLIKEYKNKRREYEK
jgi:spore germination protein YaaH